MIEAPNAGRGLRPVWLWLALLLAMVAVALLLARWPHVWLDRLGVDPVEPPVAGEPEEAPVVPAGDGSADLVSAGTLLPDEDPGDGVDAPVAGPGTDSMGGGPDRKQGSRSRARVRPVRTDLYGVLLDREGEPLADVMVTLGGAVGETAVTGGDGSFAFHDVWPGEYFLRAELNGYTLALEGLSVAPLGTQRVELTFQGRAEDLAAYRDERPREIREVRWNSWLGTDELEPRPIERAETGGRGYTVVFDLAQFDYREAAAGMPTVASVLSPDLREALAAVEPDARTLPLLVYPVIGGRGLRLAGSWGDGEAEVYIELDRLRGDLPPKGETESFVAFADRVQALRVPVALYPTGEAGCATVALTLWTRSREPEPLDHVVAVVPVGTADGEVPECTGPGSETLSAGLVRALASDRGPEASAALYVFQTESHSDQTLALYVGRNRPPEGPVPPGSEDLTVEGWQLVEGEGLGWLVSPEGLDSELAGARRDGAYGGVVDRLTHTLFPEKESARAALRHLRALAGRGARASVMARLVGAKGELYPLPLGLIDDGEGGVLGDRVDLVLPMPVRESWQAHADCLQAWTYVMPSDLVADARLACPEARPRPSHFGEDWAPFFDWLGGREEIGAGSTAADRRAEGPEGLLLLAHHDPGYGLFFKDPPGEERAKASDLGRSFRSGSVAVLVACSASGLGDDHLGWLEQLNLKGVDAAVLSSFTVDLGIGACFARRFADHLEAPRDRELTLGELVRRTRDSLRGDLGDPGHPAVHEFVLVGDPAIRICPILNGAES